MKNSNDAMAFAIEAMGGDRVDKGGNPYVLHLCEVVTILERVATEIGVAVNDEMRCAAILHDTVEDTSVTLADLHATGFSDVVVGLVDALTKREGEKPIDYWMRVIEAGPEARAIKAADALSNSRIERLNRKPTEKDKSRGVFYTELAKIMLNPWAGVEELRLDLLDNEAKVRA